jgi:hypothetical protein
MTIAVRIIVLPGLRESGSRGFKCASMALCSRLDTCCSSRPVGFFFSYLGSQLEYELVVIVQQPAINASGRVVSSDAANCQHDDQKVKDTRVFVRHVFHSVAPSGNLASLQAT